MSLRWYLLWFWFTSIWWLVMLNIFSYAFLAICWSVTILKGIDFWSPEISLPCSWTGPSCHHSSKDVPVKKGQFLSFSFKIWLKQSFSTSALLTFWTRLTLCCGECPVHHGMLTSISGLQMPVAFLTPLVTTRNKPRESLVVQMVTNLPAMQETWVQSLGQEDPWRRKWQPTPVLLPGESHGQRSLVGYSPGSHKELDTTRQLTFHFQCQVSPQRVRERACKLAPGWELLDLNLKLNVLKAGKHHVFKLFWVKLEILEILPKNLDLQLLLRKQDILPALPHGDNQLDLVATAPPKFKFVASTQPIKQNLFECKIKLPPVFQVKSFWFAWLLLQVKHKIPDCLIETC